MFFIVDRQSLPPLYPTHLHPPEFWEALGRTVATYGFLEEILGKAIFAFTGMRTIPEDQINVELGRWILGLEKALADPLGALINSYCKAVRDNGNANISNFDQLEFDLREAAAVRNALCHGSWRNAPDEGGRSVPFFVNNKREVFQVQVDVSYLEEVRKRAVGLACAIINSVTIMGWQFPGSDGPGQSFFSAQREGKN